MDLKLTDVNTGLSALQVEKRVYNGKVNKEFSYKTKTMGRIFFENTVTLFNIINILLAAAVIYVGAYENLLFMGVIIVNTLIGIAQEIKAKRTVDKLTLLTEEKAEVIRNGVTEKVTVNSIVTDDIVILRCGQQVPTDCIIADGQCDVNEALLTGEADPIHKKRGDTLLSGSFLTSGACKVQVTGVGEENYAVKLFNGAKYYKKVNSEIMSTLKKIIKIISFAIIPVGMLLFFNQLNIDGNTMENAVVNTVAAIIGMIPEGLVLLTSTV